MSNEHNTTGIIGGTIFGAAIELKSGDIMRIIIAAVIGCIISILINGLIDAIKKKFGKPKMDANAELLEFLKREMEQKKLNKFKSNGKPSNN